MRGKASQYATSRPAARITPACAGKRAGRCPDGCTPWDHPRVCGEKCLSNHLTLKRGGSPPRVRGKESCHPDFFREIGITPRVRGKGPVRRRDGAGMGITPAYAGKRLKSRETVMPSWDHPRVCGEKMVSMIPHRRSRGSPPRVRGKGECRSNACSISGITPACAGKRRMPKQCVFNFRDHPRVCGEKWLNLMNEKREQGSPPRMRGKGNLYLLDGVLDGITPAYAGKSAATPNVEAFYEGSPPRMRGKD